MWIRNAWYVAAWADEVTADALLNRIYLGTPVILYRTADGGLVAMEDRCCHRHAPLSKGRLEGDDIRCMYHGLKFAPSGKCIEIPGEEKVPPQMKVATFPVAERDSLVWIWLGDPALANEGDIVHCPRLTEPGWRHQQGYLRYDTDYRLIVDNLLDLTHLAYVRRVRRLRANPSTAVTAYASTHLRAQRFHYLIFATRPCSCRTPFAPAARDFPLHGSRPPRTMH